MVPPKSPSPLPRGLAFPPTSGRGCLPAREQDLAVRCTEVWSPACGPGPPRRHPSPSPAAPARLTFRIKLPVRARSQLDRPPRMRGAKRVPAAGMPREGGSLAGDGHHVTGQGAEREARSPVASPVRALIPWAGGAHLLTWDAGTMFPPPPKGQVRKMRGHLSCSKGVV